MKQMPHASTIAQKNVAASAKQQLLILVQGRNALDGRGTERGIRWEISFNPGGAQIRRLEHRVRIQTGHSPDRRTVPSDRIGLASGGVSQYAPIVALGLANCPGHFLSERRATYNNQA